MKIKVVMDSGKEYVTDKFEDAEAFHSALTAHLKVSNGSRYTFMTISEGNVINVSHISSYELID
ncbi:hypothetical protein [Bacillus atrophaeus]|uniref:hypothetical protein n=1 Tax=Bacillus atrophaeus TaxID=1452 RepID=UPI00077AD0C3|nr:hypothetical protein [Bacillus atrophaeus]KXZ12935.1 hypothetical protein AXI57_17160 [Bacillus atrophaeus]MCY8969625.1 hypothetical protein [Bacillus atrophaeus]MED4809545.1 hypothetical protein [Bacillus atrophaeus]GED03078.1 hypothetical protein BAT02nite_27220 [Bacillus atrophaeus]